MEITEALKSLGNSWSREEILLKIKNGEDSEKILNDFFNYKKQEIEILTDFINPENEVIFNEIEDLANIELKLINKIKTYNSNKNQLTKNGKAHKKTFQNDSKFSFDIGLFMMKWSNKFVFISLLVISAIALTKQAWA